MNGATLSVDSALAAAAHTCAGCCGDADTAAGTAAGTKGGSSTAGVAGRPGACCDGGVNLRLQSEEAEELAGMFKALGHPVRLQIVALLGRYAGQVCVCDVEGQFDLSQPTISHHLKILREAGLVAAEQRGLWVYYYLQPAATEKLRLLLGGLAE
jgi:ArsR family transcriptional regulator